MEKSAGNFQTDEDENAVMGGMRKADGKELPQNKKEKIEKEKTSTADTKSYVPSYKTLVANMEELRMNLGNHLLRGENSAGDAKEFTSCAEKNENLQDSKMKGEAQFKIEKSAIKEKISKENYINSFEQLTANAKILTDNEVNEFEERLKQNMFNSDAERKLSHIQESNSSSSTKVNLKDNESNVKLNIEDLLKGNHDLKNEEKESDDMERATRNAIEQIGQIGYGFINLNDEAEFPAEYE